MSTTSTAEPRPATESQPEVKGGVTPYLMLSNAAAAADYYKEALGAEEVARAAAPGDASGRLLHVHLYINGGSVMLSDAFPEHGCPLVSPQAFSLTLQVDDADAWFARAMAAGAEGLMPVADMFWGARYGQVKDPFGVTWAFNQPLS
jgi:uncharacterized glyoxalase superfamily protein PhnB